LISDSIIKFLKIAIQFLKNGKHFKNKNIIIIASLFELEYYLLYNIYMFNCFHPTYDILCNDVDFIDGWKYWKTL